MKQRWGEVFVSHQTFIYHRLRLSPSKHGDTNREAGNETGRTNRGKRIGLGNPGDTQTKKNPSRGKSPRLLLLPSAFPEPREKAKESRRRSRGEEAVSTNQSFAIVSIDSSKPGEHILLLALFQLAFTLCK